MSRPTGDFRRRELRPLVAEVYLQGKTFKTNRWGMRDRDYQQRPPPGVYRIAVLGPSTVLGIGVGDDETFEARLEDRLNQGRDDHDGPRFEVLNFGNRDYSPLQELMLLESKIVDFEPDALFYVASQWEGRVTARHLVDQVNAGRPAPYEFVRETLRLADITPPIARSSGQAQLEPFLDEMLGWIYRRIVRVARAHDVKPLWIYVPTPELDLDGDVASAYASLAERAGFACLDVSGAYADQDIPALWYAEWDHHPNALGHALLANELFDTLVDRDDLIPLALDGGAGGQ